MPPPDELRCHRCSMADRYAESSLNKFIKYFKEEIKDQVKGNPRNKL